MVVFFQNKLVYSERFRNLLIELKDQSIALDLLKKENNNSFMYRASYIDITQDPNILTYTAARSVDVENFPNDIWNFDREYIYLEEFLFMIYKNDITKYQKEKFCESFGRVFSSDIKTPSTIPELIKKLIKETKQQTLKWSFKEETPASFIYTLRKDITKDKFLFFELYTPKPEAKYKNPILYIQYMKGDRMISYIKTINNNGLTFDLSYVVTLQSLSLLVPRS